MTDRDALLRAICENPDDDAPRLIYADWLDEHGDPLQAEFIRLQVQYAGISLNANDRRPFVRRQFELWRDARKWRYPRADWANYGASQFVRGFCSSWTGTATEFLRFAAQYWRLGPTSIGTFQVDKTIDAKLADAQQIAKCEWFGRFREVNLWGRCLTDEWVEPVLSSSFACQWTILYVDGIRLTEKICELLLSSAARLSNCQVKLGASLSNLDRQRMLNTFGDRLTLLDPSWR